MISPVLIIKDESTTKLTLPSHVFILDQKWHLWPPKKYIRVVRTLKMHGTEPSSSLEPACYERVYFKVKCSRNMGSEDLIMFDNSQFNSQGKTAYY